MIEKEPSKLVQDDDGHWYVVPTEKIEEFYRWINHYTISGDNYWDGADFNDYIIGGIHLLTLFDWSLE